MCRPPRLSCCCSVLGKFEAVDRRDASGPLSRACGRAFELLLHPFVHTWQRQLRGFLPVVASLGPSWLAPLGRRRVCMVPGAPLSVRRGVVGILVHRRVVRRR